MSKFKSKSSKYRGVTWDFARSKWKAQFSGKFLGRYLSEESAFKAFQNAYKLRYGYSYYHKEPIIDTINNIVKIPLGKWGANNYLNLYTIVDLEDYNKIKDLILYVVSDSHNLYVKFNANTDNKRQDMPLHRYIMKCPKGYVVDHIDGNGLNNSKKNLRVCRQMNNMWNTSKRTLRGSVYKGISKDLRSGKWVVRITCNNKRYFIGRYKTEVNAAQAYNFAAEKYHGEFAKYNIYQQ
jgi:hypothetical protein